MKKSANSSDLIKSQRKKFTIRTTLLAALLLLILFGGFFIILGISKNVVIDTALDKALSSPDDYNEHAPQMLRCFFIFMDGNNNTIVSGDTSYLKDDKYKVVNKARETKDGRFMVGNFYFKCACKDSSGGVLIAVIDRTETHESTVDTAIQITLIYCVSVGLIALLAFLSSARLLQPVEESFKKQRDLITNASHELKTPLTVISTNLSVIKSEPQSTVEDNAKWIESIESQIARMQDLIQNMLELSKIEQTEPNLEELNLSVIAEGACLTFEVICFEKDVSLVSEIQDGVKVMGEKSALERLFAILLDNAIKYCNRGGKVGIHLSAEPKKVVLTVMNTGESISKEEAEHVFDRFYRTDGARKNEDKHSFGLGLSIAEATVKAHGGTISCHGVEDKGTVFKVTLPAVKEPKKSKKIRS